MRKLERMRTWIQKNREKGIKVRYISMIKLFFLFLLSEFNVSLIMKYLNSSNYVVENDSAIYSVSNHCLSSFPNEESLMH